MDTKQQLAYYEVSRSGRYISINKAIIKADNTDALIDPKTLELIASTETGFGSKVDNGMNTAERLANGIGRLVSLTPEGTEVTVVGSTINFIGNSEKVEIVVDFYKRKPTH